MPIPILDLGNDPRERGLVHGAGLRQDIAHNLDVYFRRFSKLGQSRDKVLAASEKWIPELDRLDPEFTAEMKGVAEGSGFTLPEITLLNVRYEMITGLMKEAALASLRGAVDGSPRSL